MKLAIEVSNNAFLPEVGAYRSYFQRHGFSVDVVNKGRYDPQSFDICLLFHGFHPFWKTYPKVVIGEYHSLTVGRHGRLKDLLKRLLNVRADVNVFLNDEVREKLFFPQGSGNLLRPMGFFSEFVNKYQGSKKEFDIVYSGTPRKNIETVIKRLDSLGLSVAVVGNQNPIVGNNITSFGKVDVSRSYEIMAKANVGLNYTPDEYPLNVQDCTKVIEYCALGLGVLTNRYRWINDFEKNRGGHFMGLEKVADFSSVHDFPYVVPDVSDLNWEDIMKGSGIVESIKSIVDM